MIRFWPSAFQLKQLAIVLGLALAVWLLGSHGVIAADRISIEQSLFQTANTSDIARDNFGNLTFGLFLGVMLTASLYLLFIWLVIRDRSQVFLMLLLLCLAINMATTNDILMDQIGMTGQHVRNLLQSYTMMLTYIFSIFFTYYFLEVDFNKPIMKIPLFLMAIGFLGLLVYSPYDLKPIYFSLPTLGALAIAMILVTGLLMFRQNVSGSITHIIAFLFFLAGTVAKPLFDLGFIIDTSMASQLTYSSYSLAALMFAIVIAGQFANRQEEKEHALEISNERFALAAKGSNEGLFDWNLETGEVFFSDQLKRIVGIPLESNVRGLKAWWRQVLPSDRKIVHQALRRFRASLKTAAINIEYRVQKSDEQKNWLHTKAVATRDTKTGKIVRLVGSTGDITARKQGEVALRASEVRFRSITEAHPVPVMIVSVNQERIVYASPGAETLLAMPKNTLLNEHLSSFMVDPGERHNLIQSMYDGSEVNLAEVSITRRDGHMLTVALSARRINYQNEVAMVLGLYDLTERKEAEAQIAKQHEALQQSEKMAALGGLLAGVAHELNNPLSVVVGQSTLLMEGSQDLKTVTRAEKIFKAADRCSRIVKSFLALARRKPPERKPIDINNLINSSLELLGYQFKNEHVEVTLDLAPGLSDVNADADQLIQVFTNLALNAAQAMGNWAGERKITIKTESFGPDEILVSVSDTGPGIPHDIKTKVFEPFFTTKSGKGGTGVGLSLCLNIIETHGGRLMLEDTRGGGATFYIYLPATAGHAEEEKGDTKIHLQRGLRLLLVDDEIELAQTLADLLEPEGHQITLAANGAIALDKLRQMPFDTIISDLRMPILDGPGLYEELKKSMPDFLKRIIYVTGDTLSVHVQDFLGQHPEVPVIEKPYRLMDVKQAIANLLKQNAGEGNMDSPDSHGQPN